MKNITQEQYEKIKHILPVKRGNVSIDNLTFINALLYICENGCKWRRLPKEYGKWHVSYKRFRRWVDTGIINAMLSELHVPDILNVNPQALILDSSTVKVHPDACCDLIKVENNQLDDPGSE